MAVEVTVAVAVVMAAVVVAVTLVVIGTSPRGGEDLVCLERKKRLMQKELKQKVHRKLRRLKGKVKELLVSAVMT